MRPFKMIWQVPAGSANGICLSQTPGAGGALTLNGALVSAGVANLAGTMTNVSKYVDGVTNPAQRRVYITSGGGNETGRTFTIKGTAAPLGSGQTKVQTIQETLTGPGVGLSVNSVLDYATVTEIDVDAATAGAITAGTGAIASTPWYNFELDQEYPPFNVGIGVFLVTGAATWGMEFHVDRPWPDPDAPANGLYDVFSHDTIGPGQTATKDANFAFPISACRITTTVGTGTLNWHMLQQGLVGGSSR